MLNSSFLSQFTLSTLVKLQRSKAPLALIAVVSLIGLSCGKRKPPLPPKERVSQRVEISGFQRGNQVILSFDGAVGITYAVQFAAEVNVGTWSVLTNITAATTNVMCFDSISNSQQRYYRVTTPSN